MSNGICPFAGQQPTPNFWPGNRGRKTVVCHIMEGGYQGSIDWMHDHDLSSHFAISKKGEIAQLVNVNNTAWANGLIPNGTGWLTPAKKPRPVTPKWADITVGVNPNWQTISIEHEGFTGDPLTPEMQSASLRLLKWLSEQFGFVYVRGHTLIGHCDINPLDKARCPGTAFEPLFAAGVALTATPATNNHFFSETGHWVSNAFWEFWRNEPRAIQYFGYPITEEQAEMLGDGKIYTVQYFQRARFEYHPELPDGEKVQLGLLGDEILKLKG